jgi:sugar phosphate isomerase/epimerase
MTLNQSLDRRRFLQAAGASTLGLAAMHSFLNADEKKDDPFGGFTVGVQSYTFRNFDLEPALKRIKELGLHYVEFFQKHCPLDSSEKQIKAVLDLCKTYDITPLTFGVQGFSKDHDKNKKVFEFGKALGIKTFSADPDPDSFDSLDKLVDEFKIAIAIHPHGPAGGGKLHRWYSAEKIMAAVKNHHKLIGSCIDTGHIIRADILGEKLDPAKEILTMGERNFGIHLKDNDNEAEKSGKKKGGDANVILGKGVLDVNAVLKALRKVKFDRLISIEYEAKADNPGPDVQACLDVIKEEVKKI